MIVLVSGQVTIQRIRIDVENKMRRMTKVSHRECTFAIYVIIIRIAFSKQHAINTLLQYPGQLDEMPSSGVARLAA